MAGPYLARQIAVQSNNVRCSSTREQALCRKIGLSVACGAKGAELRDKAFGAWQNSQCELSYVWSVCFHGDCLGQAVQRSQQTCACMFVAMLQVK